MRRFLDWLYRISGGLAAVSLVAIAVVVTAQIVGRFIGIVVPSATQMAGFFMCAAIFLGLAYTLAAEEHIRVTLVLEYLSDKVRWWMELWCLAAGSLVTGYFAVFACQFAWESWLLDDRADGLLPIPFVIPQGAMALGVIILFVRLIDELVQLLGSGNLVHLTSGEQAFPEKHRKFDKTAANEETRDDLGAEPPANREG